MIDEAGYSQFRWLEEFLEGVDEVGKFGVAFGEVVAIGVVELSSEIADAAVAVPIAARRVLTSASALVARSRHEAFC